MASISEFACIYSTLMLHKDKVGVSEDEINALMKAAGINNLKSSAYPGPWTLVNMYGSHYIHCKIDNCKRMLKP
ncbi:60S acidic ribosomal protein P1 [Cricetulus griseus]|uniref:60S acidic ribosomal protein P1 n=1 Tax=Cricetulus griseus TaxID=10029 RepID=G3H6V5_CRIGR|nr:60S acidic ribosomal protein P1 [Cricetulus griseus]